MEIQNSFQHIEHKNSKALISFDNGSTFKIENLIEKINSFFVHSVLYKLPEQLTQTGLGTPPDYKGRWSNSVEAEILELKSGQWQKGKMRFRVVLEFCPDEPEKMEDKNYLDDIRPIVRTKFARFQSLKAQTIRILHRQG